MTLETQANFTDFNLRPELLKTLEDKGFKSPMPVQVRVLEDESLVDGDLIVQAKTGSGKTLAFALPLLNRMDTKVREPQIIVLSPTRELAQQTAREFAWLGAGMRVRVATLVGGLDMERQIRSLRDGATVVVGTPGRVLDHIRRGTLSTSQIQSVVLDEGDHMLDMGFRDEMEEILKAMTGAERTWLFSATMPPEVLSLSRQYLDAPKKISLVSDITSHDDITQKAYIIPSRKRFEGLANVLIWEDPSRAVLFCATKIETQDIADRLCDIGFRATAIHGDMSQRERNAALGALRGGRVSILVATDVAARGLDIDAVSHVIQYGLPQNLEAFVHRSGRTGRAGHEGSNMVLLTAREARQFKYMTASAKMKMEWIPAPDVAEIAGQSRVRFEKMMIEHALESDDFESWAKDMLESDEALMLVSGLIAKAYGDQPTGYPIRADVESEMNREKSRRQDGKRPASDRNTGKKERYARPDMSGGCAVTFAQGRSDGWEVGALLGVLCRSIGIGRDDVGNIKLRDNSTTVELSPRGAAMIEARRGKLEREKLTFDSVRPISGNSMERRGKSDSHPRRDRGDSSRDSDHSRRRRFSR
ncbi:DEAD/DEAH box helicase [Synergistaceae bacterium OttesenSCG-928-D05]|nr:DEAD/DEAH box helicase [Synergistaceae bacterium OttesenSCG-928-D05]